MDPWWNVLEAIAATALGLWVAWNLGRRAGTAWVAAYAAGLSLVACWIVTSRFPVLASARLPGWIVASPDRFALGALGAVLLLGTPCMRLPDRSRRGTVLALCACLATVVGVVPAVSAARSAPVVGALPDEWFADGVCRQQTDFTCGPAAAATALRLVGIESSEREIGLLARTSDVYGTPPGVLLEVLRDAFGDRGLAADLRRSDDIGSLLAGGPVLAVVSVGLFADHWVAVRAGAPGEVWVGDPNTGWRREARAEFDARWRKVGIVLGRRDPGQP